MNLEKEFEKASQLLKEWVAEMKQQEGAIFDEVDYIKLMRSIRHEIRKTMRELGVSVLDQGKIKLHNDIAQMARELDKAMTLSAAQGNFLNEFNAAFQLYDLLNDYSPEEKGKKHETG